MAKKSGAKETLDLIHTLVNVSEITNKWLMWCECNTPKKSVFVPSVFQLRDAYAHLLKMYGYGIDKEYLSNETDCDFAGLLSDKDTFHQLQEAFAHNARAFYDCADYILLTVSQQVNSQKSIKLNRLLDLRSLLMQYDSYITHLRSSKSENIDKSYKNIVEWDSFLQFITSYYLMGGYEGVLQREIAEIKVYINKIESSFSMAVIKNHSPNFYEDKVKISKLNMFPPEITDAFKFDSKNIIPNPVDWADNLKKVIDDKLNQARAFKIELYALQKAMMNTSKIEKGRKIINSFCFILSTIASAIFTKYIESKVIIQQTITDGKVTEVSKNLFDIEFAVVFIVAFLLLFFIGSKIITKIFRK